jgi:hypothetical protein
MSKLRITLAFFGIVCLPKKRGFCPDCVMKHVSRARSFLQEAITQPELYGHFTWWAVGELSHAEDEAFDGLPQLAAFIRAERRRLSKNKFLGEPADLNVDFFDKVAYYMETGDMSGIS